jgi:Uma2 family endonuclease
VAIETSVHRLSIDETSVHRLSTDVYERMVGSGALEGLRVELLDGLLVDMSPQDEQHVWTIQQLTRLFARRLDILRVQVPLAVADGWVPEPDVALAESDPTRRRHPTTALIVVEVALSSHHVDWQKALVYARAGIPQYWLVDLPAATVHVHSEPGADGYASVVARSGDDVLDAAVEGVDQITVAKLLDL